MVCCGTFVIATSMGHAGVQPLSTPKIVNTSQIPRATKAMRIGERVFLVASMNSTFAQEKIAQYCGKQEETLLAQK